MNSVFYLGVPGSFSHQAANKFFENRVEYIAKPSFSEIVSSTNKQTSCYGILPIENSLAGSIHKNYDLLNEFNLKITGEVYLTISHFLLSYQTDISKIESVISHKVALEQCSEYLSKKEWSKIEYSSTAGAAKHIFETQDQNIAAIASKESAELYNLNILDSNIEDNHKNWTRFLIVKNSSEGVDIFQNDKSDKLSLAFTLHHHPGALYKVVQVFYENNINICKLESRPLKGEFFEYIFYLDAELLDSQDTVLFEETINRIQDFTKSLRILGVYTKGSKPEKKVDY